MVKQMFLIKRKEGMSHDDFRKYYLEQHAPLVRKAFPEIIRYAINFVHQGKREAVYDAVTEIVWPDFETLKRLKDSSTYQREIVPDEANFIAEGRPMTFLAEEFVAKDVQKPK